MCFTNEDYDWIARVCEVGTATAVQDIKCDECHGPISCGDLAHTVHQQEYEECPFCRGDDGEECTCGDGDFGETFDANWCGDCQKFRDAIKAMELAEGCAESESEPPLGMMLEELGNMDPDRRREYGENALKMFPELMGYLERVGMIEER